MADDFKKHTISGLTWSTISQTINQLLKFIIGVILARLLTPEVFGLIGMIGVLVGFAHIFNDLGLGAALIQKQDAKQKHYSSIFWINIGVGFALMLIFMGASTWIAAFYNEPILVPLTILISVNFFLGSFNIVQRTLFQKHMKFKYLAIVEVVALVFSGIVAVTMALLGFGVWSLAIQSLLVTATMVALMWYISDWRPAFLFDWKAVQDLLQFSSNLLGFSTLNYWTRNADNLLIGRFLGSSSLGLYGKAYSIMIFPLTNFSQVVGRVMFPAFSLIQEDKQRIKRAYLRISRDIALISFPLMSGLLVVSDSFVLAVFGSQWSGMIPILQVFCLVGMVQSIGTLNGNIYLSQGRTDLQLKVGGTIGVLGVVAIIIGLKWGILGVAYSYTIFSLLATYPSIRIAVSLISITFTEVAVNISGVLGCAAVMAMAVWLLFFILPMDWSHWAYLAVQVPFGIIVYLSLIHFFKIRAYIEVFELLKEQWHHRFNRRKLTPIV